MSGSAAGGAGAGTGASLANVFSLDSESEDEALNPRELAARQLEAQRQAIAKREASKLARQPVQDASVYQYDEVYDEIAESRDRAASAKATASSSAPGRVRESRYVAKLLERAEERKREDDLVREKRLKKELDEEEAEAGGTERFVTSAYRQKLEDNRKFELEKRREDELAAAHEVKGKSNLAGFYSNLMTRNAAFGGGASAVVTASITSQASVRQQHGKSSPPPGPQDRTRRGSDPNDQDLRRRSRSPYSWPPRHHSRSASPRRQRRRSRSASPRRQRRRSRSASPSSTTEHDRGEKRARSIGDAVAPTAKRSKAEVEEKRAAARARFLARKQSQSQSNGQ